MKEINEYYLGLDMGEGSLGWAVTTPDYHVVKKADAPQSFSRLLHYMSTSPASFSPIWIGIKNGLISLQNS